MITATMGTEARAATPSDGAELCAQLGYGHMNAIGDDELPSTTGNIDVGGTATQIAAGQARTCALLDTGDVRCWGYNASGQLGYGHMNAIGDDEAPSTAGNVSIGGAVKELAVGLCALTLSLKGRLQMEGLRHG